MFVNIKITYWYLIPIELKLLASAYRMARRIQALKLSTSFLTFQYHVKYQARLTRATLQTVVNAKNMSYGRTRSFPTLDDAKSRNKANKLDKNANDLEEIKSGDERTYEV